MSMLRIRFSLWILVTVLTALLVAIYITYRRQLSTGQSSAIIFAGSVGLTALIGIGAQQLNLTKVSMDSLVMIEMASALGQGLLITEIPTTYLLNRPLFLPLAHAPALALTGDFYLHALTPALGITSLVSFGWLTNEILRESHAPSWWALLLSLIGTVAVGSSYLVLFQIFYVNGHLAFAFYLALLVGSSWLAASRGEPQWFALAIPAVVGLILLRLEGPIVVTLALVPIILSRNLPFLMRGAVTATYSVVVLVTFGTFVTLSGRGHLDDRSIVGAMATAVFLSVLLVLGRWFPNPQVIRRLPWLVLAGLILITGAMSYRRPEHMQVSALALMENVTSAGQWGVTWIGLSVLVLLALLVLRSPFPAFWVVPVIGFAPLLFVLVYFRGPYRVGWGDSANRMLTHVLLVAVLYVVLAAGGALRREDQGSSAGLKESPRSLSGVPLNDSNS